MNDYQSALDGAALFDLSQHGKIEVAGPDAPSFLHNLCTQDIKGLPLGASCEAFLTTNKARVIAHIWITRRDANVLLLDMIEGQAEKVLKHLNQFLISEQAELADRSHEFGLLRLVGPKSAELLTRFGITPAREHCFLALDGFDLLPQAPDIATVRQGLIEGGAVLGSAETYRTLRIEAGVPEYGIDMDENRFAMEVNRTAQAISYAKGCYLGQETIVMARDRGQVNRLMMGLKIAAGSPLAPGSKLFRAGEEIGHATSSVFSPRLGQVVALAYLRRGHSDAGTEVVIDPTSDGRTGIVSALPFFSGAVNTLP